MSFNRLPVWGGAAVVAAGLVAASAGHSPAAHTTGPSTRPADPGDRREMLPPAGKPVEASGIRLAVPEGWGRFTALEQGSRVVHLVGDGKGLPAVDERGGPLQVGLSIERFAGDATVDARVESLTAESKAAPGRTLVGQVETETVKLAGGADGRMMYVTFDKGRGRKSFYEKLVVADPRGGTWVVTGWIVASADSTLPRRGSVLEKRLLPYVQSLTVPGKGE